MTGWWLVTFILLWLVMLAVVALLMGTLRQLGLLQQQLGLNASTQSAHTGDDPPLEQDGPIIGAELTGDLYEDLATINGYGVLARATVRRAAGTVFVFLTPLCETCQQIVEPLNAFAEARQPELHISVILRADADACRAFLGIFPLHLPVIGDHDQEITKRFDVHRTPLGLFYDADGILVRKAILMGPEYLSALVGDEISADAIAARHLVPPVVSTSALAPQSSAAELNSAVASHMSVSIDG